MDPHSFIVRAEAQRWLGIAEKLLMGHDLVGSKTFAIRARDSDPRLEAADQILAIADTLLAAEKQVVGNNGAQQPDFYAILQLVRFVQDTDHIASQYRRLAVMLNPHQNRFPYSDHAFQLVNDAWAVLSNPMRKAMYDAELDFPPQQEMNTIGFDLEQQHQQQQQEQHNFFTIDHFGPDHEQELPDPDTFQTREERSHQQHNFLSQNPVRSVPEQFFQHHEQEQLFQPKVQFTSAPHQQTQPPPQPSPPQPHMQPPTPPPPAAPPQPPLSWPQAPPLSQPQQLQRTQQQQQEQQQPRQEIQQEEQQPESLEQNSVQLPTQVNRNNGVMEEEVETETETETEAENTDKSPTFWTACPFCFYMYEYPKVYADCTLRCDHCKRAFQAVSISSPPSMAEGQEPYFYCWGYFPLGISISHLSKTNGAATNSKWTPFSPLHNASSNVHNHSNGRAAPKKNHFVNKNSGPRIYIDDVTDDIFTGISEPSDDSDVEWNITIEKR